MDWIAEKLFELFQEILKGEFSNLDQLLPLLLLIVIAGCFLAREQLIHFLRNTIQNTEAYLDAQKLKQDVEDKQSQLRKEAYRLAKDLQKLREYKRTFYQTKAEVLTSVSGITPPLKEEDQELLFKKVSTLESQYNSSVKILEDREGLINYIAGISRAEYLQLHAEDIASELLE